MPDSRPSPSSSCGTHACDCTRVPAAPAVGGVRLSSSRTHVAAKVDALLGGATELAGAGWEQRLEALLEGLTFSERPALYATAVGGDAPVTVTAETALARARTPWLPRVLGDGSLVPHFQPIVALADGRTHGYESLLRAEVDGRLLSGGEIVAAAGAHDMLFNLDQAGRTAALEHGIPALPDGAMLFVNFTPSAIYDPEICLRTTWAVARRFDFPLERVCFEVVESETFPDLDFLRRILDRYRAEGAQVALDDLGAGHSSLSYLRTLRPDVVKLDRELVTGVDRDEPRQRLVSALVDYAHELGIRVVAEGIETADELAVVTALGADLGQGWHLGRPAPRPAPVDPALVSGGLRVPAG